MGKKGKYPEIHEKKTVFVKIHYEMEFLLLFIKQDISFIKTKKTSCFPFDALKIWPKQRDQKKLVCAVITDYDAEGKISLNKLFSLIPKKRKGL
ncbi:MAG: hypothetical protein WCS73_04400 [Lentisphaeria bacterium]